MAEGGLRHSHLEPQSVVPSVGKMYVGTSPALMAPLLAPPLQRQISNLTTQNCKTSNEENYDFMQLDTFPVIL